MRKLSKQTQTKALLSPSYANRELTICVSHNIRFIRVDFIELTATILTLSMKKINFPMLLTGVSPLHGVEQKSTR